MREERRGEESNKAASEHWTGHAMVGQKTRRDEWRRGDEEQRRDERRKKKK